MLRILSFIIITIVHLFITIIIIISEIVTLRCPASHLKCLGSSLGQGVPVRLIEMLRLDLLSFFKYWRKRWRILFREVGVRGALKRRRWRSGGSGGGGCGKKVKVEEGPNSNTTLQCIFEQTGESRIKYGERKTGVEKMVLAYVYALLVINT